MDIVLPGWAEDLEVISVTQLPPAPDKLAPVKRWLNSSVGDLSVTQVSYLIPSYINNWLEENRKEPYVQEGLRQIPEDNLVYI